MKKYIILVLTLLLFCNMNVYANESINVSLYQCVDGDTAKFKYKNDVITARFLGIDTPETHHPTKGEEPWGKEASNYTCKSLTNSKYSNSLKYLMPLFTFISSPFRLM